MIGIKSKKAERILKGLEELVEHEGIGSSADIEELARETLELMYDFIKNNAAEYYEGKADGMETIIRLMIGTN